MTNRLGGVGRSYEAFRSNCGYCHYQKLCEGRGVLGVWGGLKGGWKRFKTCMCLVLMGERKRIKPAHIPLALHIKMYTNLGWVHPEGRCGR